MTSTSENNKIELGILGCCMWDDKNLVKCTARGITSAMFDDMKASQLYDRMLILDKKGIIPDPGVMVENYSKNKEMFNFVLTVTQTYATGVYLDNWINYFLESYCKREMFKLSTSYQGDMEGNFIEATEAFIEKTRKTIHLSTKKQLKNNKEIVAETHNMIQTMAESPDSYICRYCIPGVDAIFTHERQLMHVIGAPPNVGKTGFVLSCMINQISKGVKPVLFCHETPVKLITKRMIAMLSNLPTWKIDKYNNLQGQEMANYQYAVKYLMENADNYRIFAKSDFRHNPLSIRAELLSLCETGFKPDMVAVDYLQNMKRDKHTEKMSQVEFVENCAFEINTVFGDFNVAGILLSQLNRARDEGEGEYSMKDLKGSSGIEQEADSITFLQRKGRGFEGLTKVRWYTAKSRGGKDVNAELEFDSGNGRFIKVISKFDTGRQY